jgi:hypothetical protein
VLKFTPIQFSLPKHNLSLLKSTVFHFCTYFPLHFTIFPFILLYSPAFSCIPLQSPVFPVIPLYSLVFPCFPLYSSVFPWLSVSQSVCEITECRACFAAKNEENRPIYSKFKANVSLLIIIKCIFGNWHGKSLSTFLNLRCFTVWSTVSYKFPRTVNLRYKKYSNCVVNLFKKINWNILYKMCALSSDQKHSVPLLVWVNWDKYSWKNWIVISFPE